MNRQRVIFYLVFAFFHLFLTIFAFYVDSQKGDVTFLLKLVPWISFMKWGAFLGLLLFLTAFGWSFFHARKVNKERDALEHEMNTLKAKLFDFQESEKAKRPANPNVKS